jgi:8-oxo-dGTP diphosphatase
LRREFPEAPIVGVGAVVIEGDCVLLVRRGQEPLKEEWSLPGGVLELGETLENGVVRELFEETGLTVEVVSIVEVLDRIVLEDRAEEVDSPGDSQKRIRYHYVLVDFLCRVVGGSLGAASDAADARWVSREELNGPSIYRVAPVTVLVIEKALRKMETI